MGPLSLCSRLFTGNSSPTERTEPLENETTLFLYFSRSVFVNNILKFTTHSGFNNKFYWLHGSSVHSPRHWSSLTGRTLGGTHCVRRRHRGHLLKLGFGWLSAQHRLPEGRLAVGHRYTVPPGGLGQEMQAGNLFCECVPVEKKQMLFLHTTLFFSHRWVMWQLSPVFWVNDGVDEGVVDGRCLGDNSRNRFGIRAEETPVSERVQMFCEEEIYTHTLWSYCCFTLTFCW